MARRFRRHGPAGRDRFPGRVASGVLTLVALVTVVAIWGVKPTRLVQGWSVPLIDQSPNPEAAKLANAEGRRYFDAGDFTRAAQRFGVASRALPGVAEYHNNYGWALFRAGHLNGAQRELEKAIRIDSTRAIAHANLAEVWLARGDTTKGVAAYRRFLEVNTDPQHEQLAIDRLRRISRYFNPTM